MTRPVELLTVAGMATADRLTVAAGTPGATLMERAGLAVAEAAERLAAAPGAGRILVLCGPGNNGGDGFVAAVALASRGPAVEVASLCPVEKRSGDAAAAAAAWRGDVGDATQARLAGRDVIVDALFGAGLSRPLEGPTRALVARINAAGIPVLAVDLPSGVSGDTGAVQGEAIRAAATVTFFCLKPGHLLMPGRDLCGPVTLVDIGIAASVLAEAGSALFENRPESWWAAFPRPQAASHKYTRGHLLVVSGPMPTLGAARLSAHGGLRAGAGLVTVASPPDALAAHAAQLTSVMLKRFDGPHELAEILDDARKNAVVLGPGLGHHDDTPGLIRAALAPSARPRAAVLDADALTLFSGKARELRHIVASVSGEVVVTPHDGEFAKLFDGIDAVLQARSKVERARAGARALGATVVLKGADTVVASPDGRAAIAGQDAPWLATAGSGDVLSGIVGALLAQGMPAFEAAAAAVWLHAAAADRFGPGLISEDLPGLLPAVLRDLYARPPGPSCRDPSGVR